MIKLKDKKHDTERIKSNVRFSLRTYLKIGHLHNSRCPEQRSVNTSFGAFHII
jgi:hypothetical protein